MPITSQVIGQTRGATVMLFRLKDRLKLVGVEVKFPLQNRLYLKNHNDLTFDPTQISEQQMLAQMFDSITKSSFHVVSNEIGGLIDSNMAKSIIHAFENKKPVVITNKPFFNTDVSVEVRQKIEQNLDKIHVKGLLKLDNPGLYDFVRQIADKEIKYS